MGQEEAQGEVGRRVAPEESPVKTIAQWWQQFEAEVIPATAPAIQRQEMRRSFYAGFQASLRAGIEMADESKASDDIGVTMIQRLHEEAARFGADVQAGRD
jgi:hypothetical protein